MDASIPIGSVRITGPELHLSEEESARSTAFGRADRLAIAGQLAAGLAHEMNTPLGSISGHAEESIEILEGAVHGRLTQARMRELRERLLAIMRQANRCSRIATRLLQFARAGQPAASHCQIAQVEAVVLELLSSTANAKGVLINSRIAEGLPPAPLTAPEMEQLLVNLIQNSLDACDAGDRITVEATLGPGSLIVVISDSGCGMTPDVLSRIFDPFFTTNVGKGTGLGLSVCHGIVRSVGGSIEVESVAGQGTRVTVLLPVNCPTKVMDSTDARAVSQQALQVSIDNQ